MEFDFTDEQKRIFAFVKSEQGHGIIDAVAGAGKTTTIMECAQFVKDKSQILFCAFNTSISAEIARRFQQKGLNEVTVKTIHALGRQILQDNNNNGIDIKVDDAKYTKLLKEAALQERIKPFIDNILTINNLDSLAIIDERQHFAVRNLLYRINNKLIDINQKFRATITKEEPAAFEELVIHFGIFNSIEAAKQDFKKEVLNYFEAHKILLERGNEFSKRTMIIDFTDMLYLPYIWGLQPRKKYEFLFIDECQDLSKAQFAVAAKYGKKDGRVLAVGDPCQSIYGFTGADISSFQRVKDYTKATQLPLTVCFRCPVKIIELAQLIRADIVGVKEEQGEVKTLFWEDITNEAKPGDLIISRLRSPILLLVFAFIDKNIKVQIHPDDVTEIITEIKTIFKPNELNINLSALPNEFRQLRDEVLNRWKWIIIKNAERITDSSERNMHIDNETQYLEQKLDFLQKKYEQWKEECKSILQIIEKIKVFITAPNNSIKLSTIHRAKGLENDKVFILDYDELPYNRLAQKDWQKTQELNLKYVAITRAKKELVLIETKNQEDIKEEESLFDNLPFDL